MRFRDRPYSIFTSFTANGRQLPRENAHLACGIAADRLHGRAGGHAGAQQARGGHQGVQGHHASCSIASYRELSRFKRRDSMATAGEALAARMVRAAAGGVLTRSLRLYRSGRTGIDRSRRFQPA